MNIHTFQQLHIVLFTHLQHLTHVEIENMTVWCKVQLAMELYVDQQQRLKSPVSLRGFQGLSSVFQNPAHT